MPTVTNMPRCQGLWDEQDINLYNAYPFFIAANQYQRVQNYMIWDKLTGTIPWEPNMGLTIRGVNAEPTPVVRQIPSPQIISALPLKDVMSIRERKEEETLYGHDFESPLIHWLPSFKDWRQNQMDFAVKDVNDKGILYADQFYRAKIWEKSPVIYICGKAGELTEAPTQALGQPDANGNFTAVGSKTNAWLKTVVDAVGKDITGTLTLRQISKALTIFTQDIDAPPYEGAANMPKDGMGIMGKYVLVTSLDGQANWLDDGYLQQFKPLDLDTPHDGFQGDLFGRVRIKYERFPLRFNYARDAVTIPAPQTYQANPAAYNFGETLPNPDYINAQYEVAWLCGAEAYRTIKIGPPPREFASGKMTAKRFNSLQWNGEPIVTDNVLRQCLDAAGNLVLDTNKYGELLQIIMQMKFGILPCNRRYIMPIVFRRSRISIAKG